MDTTVQKPAQKAGILGQVRHKDFHETEHKSLCYLTLFSWLQIYELPGAVKVDGQPYPAVKRLRANLHVVGSEKRLKAERYRKISHSNLQKFLGSKYDENDGTLDLKFEFLPGKSLDEKLKSGGPPFGWKHLIKYSIHIAQGMMELHSAPNISHGGLKPSNIILKTNGDVAVADWYCSSLIDHDEMIDVLKVSDPLFLAPEILAGSCDVFSEESDVYAFGMCLLMVSYFKNQVSVHAAFHCC
jgi:serine/threonine protein kinase